MNNKPTACLWRFFGVAVLAATAVTLNPQKSCAQDLPQPQKLMSPEFKESVLKRLDELLIENYVSPETAAAMSDRLKDRMAHGDFDKITDEREFAFALTENMNSVAHDEHLHVNVGSLPSGSSSGNTEEQTRDEARENFYFRRVERLAGNVGYLKLDGFSSPSIAGPTAIAAMNFLSNSSALIVDLRENGGGDPRMIQLICSYFFDRSTYLNSIYWRSGDRTDQYWTLPFVLGSRMPTIPIFVLTSNYSFSGAEEFAYDLKMLKRGKIVGETTQGGANPTHPFSLADKFVVYIPVGRAINPISGKNWEGTGVEPDEKTSASDAFSTAHIEALRRIVDSSADPNDRREAKWALPAVTAVAHPPSLTPELLQRFVGEYGTLHHITLENGGLVSQSHSFPKRKLTPLTSNLMQIIGFDDIRIEFLSDSSGKVVALKVIYKDGASDEVEKRQ